MIEFFKYHGTGNDFIMIDNRQLQFKGDKVAFARKWCERRFGIGSDGVIFLENSADSDFLMDFYNPDGSQSFCGNGSRCALAFASFLGIIGDHASFNAIDGKHIGEIKNELVYIKMGNVEGIEHIGDDHFIHTGSPHYISYCSDSDERDIISFGKQIRYSEKYQQNGTNVNLIKEVENDRIDLRTYERGVENETFACGTGATAAALSFAFKHNLNEGIVKVDVKGGKLQVAFKRKNDNFSDVWLIGPAVQVFKGSISDDH
ncbi:MAG: diaminopimelate epimerase [Crocinitomicaceae bacterium]|nr:diaminopimelate epimerase [Crocinitomicaceae bacterium]